MKKILIVDDELSIQRSLHNTFKNSYHTKTAGSGLEALEKIESCKFNLVLMDQKMPGLDGLEVLEKIRQIDESVMVIMLTAHGSIESSEIGRAHV